MTSMSTVIPFSLHNSEATENRAQNTATPQGDDATWLLSSTSTKTTTMTDNGTSGAGSRKQRSCMTCRRRKVRCDRLTPCSNCRLAGIACVVPTSTQTPRWARRIQQQQQQQQQRRRQQEQEQEQEYDRIDKGSTSSACLPAAITTTTPAEAFPTPTSSLLLSPSSNPLTDAAAIQQRLQHLETIVGNLAALQTGGGGGGGGVGGRETSPQSGPPSTQKSMISKFGRLVLHGGDDASQSRYVASGFWSQISDELDELRAGCAFMAGQGEGEGIDHDDDEYDDDDFDNDNNDDDEQHNADTNYDNNNNNNNTNNNRSPTLLASPETSYAQPHPFLFGHDPWSHHDNLAHYRPLPSQIPFLFQEYLANVNAVAQVIHVPSVRKLMDSTSTSTSTSTGTTSKTKEKKPADEALLFSIYYAAVASMEDEDVVRCFGTAQSQLLQQFRRGFELAMTQARFLYQGDLRLVQAMVIFLMLVRRFESSRFVWMLAGLAIRMGQSLGLQRDGSHFGPSVLSPFEAEVRRRVWWSLCALDVRTAEDQGSDLTILPDTFDTRMPLNINDSDLVEDATKPPVERRHELTDMSHSVFSFEMCRLTQNMMALGTASSATKTQTDRLSPEQVLEAQRSMLDEVVARLNDVYLQYAPDTNSGVYWAGLTCTRLVLAKMTLIVYLPTFLQKRSSSSSPPGGQGPSEGPPEVETPEDLHLRKKLLSAAIEVAEFNHALHSEPAGLRWRWLIETYTQWHGLAYLLTECGGRRPWDPAMERAWTGLHSPYLIGKPKPRHVSTPSTDSSVKSTDSKQNSTSTARNQLFWLPLRRLMARARRHRDREVIRLRQDPQAARRLEYAYLMDVADGCSRPVSNPGYVEDFRLRWRSLVHLDKASTGGTEQQQEQEQQVQQAQEQQQPLPVTEPVNQNPLLDFTFVDPSQNIDTNINGFNGLDVLVGDNNTNNTNNDGLQWPDVDIDTDVDMDWGSWFASTREFGREF